MHSTEMKESNMESSFKLMVVSLVLKKNLFYVRSESE